MGQPYPNGTFFQLQTNLSTKTAFQSYLSGKVLAEKGEKRHSTFAETQYGPRFEHLAPLLRHRGYCGTVICECSGTQADDALTMLRLWENCETKDI